MEVAVDGVEIVEVVVDGEEVVVEAVVVVLAAEITSGQPLRCVTTMQAPVAERKAVQAAAPTRPAEPHTPFVEWTVRVAKEVVMPQLRYVQ